jgi:hypothetical protein
MTDHYKAIEASGTVGIVEEIILFDWDHMEIGTHIKEMLNKNTLGEKFESCLLQKDMPAIALLYIILYSDKTHSKLFLQEFNSQFPNCNTLFNEIYDNYVKYNIRPAKTYLFPKKILNKYTFALSMLEIVLSNLDENDEKLTHLKQFIINFDKCISYIEQSSVEELSFDNKIKELFKEIFTKKTKGGNPYHATSNNTLKGYFSTYSNRTANQNAQTYISKPVISPYDYIKEMTEIINNINSKIKNESNRIIMYYMIYISIILHPLSVEFPNSVSYILNLILDINNTTPQQGGNKKYTKTRKLIRNRKKMQSRKIKKSRKSRK